MAASDAPIAKEEKDPVGLRLSAAKTQRPDQVVVNAELTNQGKTAVVLDSEWAAYFTWEVTAPDATRLEAIRVGDVGPAKPAEIKQRFVKLEPAKSLSKSFELTKGFRRFMYGHGAVSGPGGAIAHIPTGYEETVRFEIPKQVRSVRVRLQYGPGLGAAAGFKVAFGLDPRDLQVWHGQAASEEVAIELR